MVKTFKDPHEISLVFHPLTAEAWSDFEELFGRRGACGGCWCMWWRFARGILIYTVNGELSIVSPLEPSFYPQKSGSETQNSPAFNIFFPKYQVVVLVRPQLINEQPEGAL